MASPAPCLLVLRDQINRRWPDRNKASDGIMGDASHQARDSDHNRGDAIDITHWPAGGLDVGVLAEELRRQMASYAQGRVLYLIFNARIVSAQANWQWRKYGGANPHKNHLHLSIVPAKRTETRPWKLR